MLSTASFKYGKQGVSSVKAEKRLYEQTLRSIMLYGVVTHKYGQNYLVHTLT